MKANEFVKGFGISTAKDVLDNADVSRAACFAMITEPHIDYTELKCLVESHELVEYFGGLSKAKSRLSNISGDVDRLKQAIADVESCQ